LSNCSLEQLNVSTLTTLTMLKWYQILHWIIFNHIDEYPTRSLIRRT
jgi:hypothetical protein